MAFWNGRVVRLSGAALLVAGVALVAGACGGSSSTPAPTGTSAPVATPTQAAAQSQGTGSGGNVLTGAVSKLSDITSYKFTMTMKGGTYGSLIGDTPITGTVIVSPQKAAEMTFMGMDIIEIGGKTYVNLGGAWTESTDSSQASMADNFAPEKMFGSYITDQTASGYNLVGEEQKNGVATMHFSADASVMNEYSSLLGVEGGTWSADVWIAKTGGYPVSVKVLNTGGSSAFEFSMDITNVNDPANKVVAPI